MSDLDKKDENYGSQVGERRIYEAPEIIVYGTISALAMGSTQNTADSTGVISAHG